MEGHPTLYIGSEESSESVHGQSPRHSVGTPAQVQTQPPPAQAVYLPFIQEFVHIIKEATQKPIDSVLDDHYEKIRKQGAKVFMGTTNQMVAEEWLRNTERVLNRIECMTKKKVNYVASLFEQDALDWWETVLESRSVPETLT